MLDWVMPCTGFSECSPMRGSQGVCIGQLLVVQSIEQPTTDQWRKEYVSSTTKCMPAIPEEQFCAGNVDIKHCLRVLYSGI
jgi:hypothetical protein